MERHSLSELWRAAVLLLTTLSKTCGAPSGGLTPPRILPKVCPECSPSAPNPLLAASSRSLFTFEQQSGVKPLHSKFASAPQETRL